MKRRLLLLSFALLYVLAGQMQTALGQTPEPSPPEQFLNTTYPTPTGPTICVGTVTGITCDSQYQASASGLQSALNEASTNDGGASVVLNSTSTMSGSFNMPSRPTSATGWIIIRTSNLAGISAAETRVNPVTHAAAMPKLEIQSDDPVVKFTTGAHHYRLVGLEIRLVGVVGDNSAGHTTNLVRIGSSEASPDLLPSEVIVDRCYIHGHSTANVKRGVGLNSKSSAVIDSYISEIHLDYEESQAIMGWNGPGPFKIVNNYLEAAGENLFFGGVAKIQGVIPSDIEIRRNHIFKPEAWHSSSWQVKNLLELKSALRVLIDGNILENNWADAQSGRSVIIKVSDEAIWNTTQDVTFTNNIVRHTTGGLNISGHSTATRNTQRVKVANNLFDDVNPARWGDASGGEFLIITQADYVTLDHNTVFHTGNVISLSGTPTSNFVFRNNVMNRNASGVKGDSRSEGTDSLNTYAPGYVFVRNIIAGADPAKYPADNYFPTDFDAQFVNRAGGDYHLSATSPGKGGATDGTDVGADIDDLSVATKGVISGVWTDSGSQDVIWTNLVGVVASGNDLTKTANTAWWNAGAISSQTLTGDGYVEFSTGENDTGKACGLSNGSANQNYTEIDYAIMLGAGNVMRVYENGVLKGIFGNYVPGERYRVAVEGGVVKYYRDGVLIYTSTVAPTYPLLVDTSLYSTGATITDAVIKGIVTWTNLVGVAASGNGLTKTSTVAGWNAGANSVQTLSGDGYVEFSTDENTTGKMCGLSNGSASQTYTEIDYAISLGAANQVRVYENGVLKGSFGTYVAGDKFKVAVEGGVVKYYRDGVLFYTSTVAPTYPLLVDTSFNTPGATITDAGIVGAWSD